MVVQLVNRSGRFQPRRPAANDHNIALLKQVIDDFAAEDLVLVTEFLTYALPGEEPGAYKAAFPALIEGGSRICLDLGADILKIPFPGTAQACANVTAMCGEVPWAVLSAGVDHATFLGQVDTAMANGASGVIGDRAFHADERVVTLLAKSLSHGLLLAGVGRAVKHAGQTTLYLTPMHAARDKLMGLIANVHAALSHVKAVAEQMPRADRWTVFLDYVVARIIRPLPPWPMQKQVAMAV